MRHLAILGASGHGRVVADVAVQAGWEAVSFFDDGEVDETSLRWPFVGNTDQLLARRQGYSAAFVAIGNNRIRMEKLELLLSSGLHLPSLVHPATTVDSSVHISDGVLVCAGVVVNCDVHIGPGVILNTACSVDHDCVLEAGVHISPGANLAGGVTCEARAWVGIGAAVCPGVRIGEETIVGAGAAVIDDLPARATAVGVPARVLPAFPTQNGDKC